MSLIGTVHTPEIFWSRFFATSEGPHFETKMILMIFRISKDKVGMDSNCESLLNCLKRT